MIRERFLLEAEAAGIGPLAELNDRSHAWAEQVRNTRVHAETGQTPIARFVAGGPPRAADPVLPHEAFGWSAVGAVAKTATVSLAGNRSQADPWLIGQRVEPRADPKTSPSLTVFVDGAAGIATPLLIGRHTHPPVPQAARPQPIPTAVDCLGLVQAAHQEQTIARIAHRDLPLPGLDALAPAGDGDDPTATTAPARPTSDPHHPRPPGDPLRPHPDPVHQARRRPRPGRPPSPRRGDRPHRLLRRRGHPRGQLRRGRRRQDRRRPATVATLDPPATTWSTSPTRRLGPVGWTWRSSRRRAPPPASTRPR